MNRDFGLDDSAISYSYTGAPGSWFSMDGRPSAQRSFVYGAGLSWMKDYSAVTVEYRGLSNAGHSEEYLGARMTLRF
jgi:hypothetical protein